MLKAGNKSSKGAVSRRHLPFCRLDNRTIYLGIHFLLPFEYCPGPYPTLFIITTRTTSCRSTLPPMSGRYTVQEAQMPGSTEARPASMSTSLTIRARTQGAMVSLASRTLPPPSRETHRGHTDGDGIPWEARPVTPPRCTQARHRA